MWRPLSEETGAVEQAFLDAARATLMPIAALRHVSRVSDTRLSVAMPDGREALVEFVAGPQQPARFNDREAVRFDLSGQAAIGAIGYGLAGQAVIDVRTRAFVDLRCEIRWQSDAARPR